jgi:uncharacterized membrane protein
LPLEFPHRILVPLAALKPLLPVFLSYMLSFIYLGIYWNNHHHMLNTTTHVSSGFLWTNLHLLFRLSPFPFTTGCMGENHFAPTPTAVYGFVLLMAAIAYHVLQRAIIATQGPESLLAAAIGNDRNCKLSPVLYLIEVPLAFMSPWIFSGIHTFIAFIGLIPDRRIERIFAERQR